MTETPKVIELLDRTIREQQAKISELRAALHGLAFNKVENCWCPLSLGNPMYSTHSGACKAARKAMGVPE